jgi:antitoxin FitA
MTAWRGELYHRQRKEVPTMAAVSSRNLDDRVRERLRIRAAAHGRSMEAEMRAILVEAVSEPMEITGLFATVIDRFSTIGGVELDIAGQGAHPR